MPLREQFLTILSPAQGLDLSRPPTTLDLKKTPFTRNTQFAFGEIRKRWGRTQFSGSSDPVAFSAPATAIMHILQYFNTDGADYLLVWSRNKFGRYDVSSDTFMNLTPQTGFVDTDFTGLADDLFSSAYYEATDDLYFTNYVNGVFKWTGSTGSRATLVYPTSALRAKVIRSFAGHLNFYGVQDTGNTIPRGVVWTDAGSELLYTGTGGSVSLAGGADFIMSAEPLGPNMAIYLENSIFLQEHVGGSIVYRFTPRINTVGLFAERAVANLGSEHIFLGNDLQVYSYDGGTDLTTIGDPIISELRTIIDVNAGHRSFMVVVEELSEVWLYIVRSGHTFADFVYKYNYVDRTWSADSFDIEVGAVGFYRKQTAGVSWDASTGTWDSHSERWDLRTFVTRFPEPLAGDINGKLTRYASTLYSDDGATIDVIFDTADAVIVEDYTRLYKRYLDFNFEAKGTVVDVYYSVDEGTTYTLLRTVTLTAAWTRYNVECDVNDVKARFRMRQTSIVGQLSARNFELGVVVRGKVL